MQNYFPFLVDPMDYSAAGIAARAQGRAAVPGMSLPQMVVPPPMPPVGDQTDYSAAGIAARGGNMAAAPGQSLPRMVTPPPMPPIGDTTDYSAGGIAQRGGSMAAAPGMSIPSAPSMPSMPAMPSIPISLSPGAPMVNIGDNTDYSAGGIAARGGAKAATPGQSLPQESQTFKKAILMIKAAIDPEGFKSILENSKAVAGRAGQSIADNMPDICLLYTSDAADE